MMMRALWIALALVVLASGEARAATCTFAAGATTWSAIGTTSPADNTDCTTLDDSDDAYVIPTGATVTVTGDLVMTGAGSISVTGTGALIVSVESNATAEQLLLTLGSGGLTCASTATCTLQGSWRTWGVTPSDTSATLSDAANTIWRVPRMRLCPAASGVDCNTGSQDQTFRFEWLDAVWDLGSGGTLYDNFPDTSTDGIADGLTTQNDYVVMLDTDPSDGYVPADPFHTYQVTTATGSGTCNGANCSLIDIAVRQSPDGIDPGGNPLATRDILEGTLATAITAGQRLITLPAATITYDQQYAGRRIFFESAETWGAGTGFPRDYGYVIQEAWDCAAAPAAPSPCAGATADWVRLLDPRGVALASGSTDQFWISVAAPVPGDAFGVLVPVAFDCATAGACKVTLTGAGVTATGVVFRQLDELDLGAGTTLGPYFALFDTRSTNEQYGIEVQGDDVTITKGSVVGHQLNITAGENWHAIGVDTATSTAARLSISDVAGRYLPDDMFLTDGSVTLTGLQMQRILCQEMARGSATAADNASSANFISWDGGVTTAPTLNGFVSATCNGDDTTGDWPFSLGTGSILTGALIQNGVVMGGSDSPFQRMATAPDVRIDNLLIAGNHQTITGSVLTGIANRVVARENTQSVAAELAYYNFVQLDNSLVFDNLLTASTTNHVIYQNTTFTGTNFAIFDNKTNATNCANTVGGAGTGVCSMLYLNGAPATTILSRFFLGNRPNTYQTERLARAGTFGIGIRAVTTTAATTNLVTGFGAAYITGTAGSPGPINLQNSAASVNNFFGGAAGSACFFETKDDGFPVLDTSGVLVTVKNVPFGFADPQRGRFDPSPNGPADDNGCGVRSGAAAPGNLPSWGHAWARIPAEKMDDAFSASSRQSNVVTY